MLSAISILFGLSMPLLFVFCAFCSVNIKSYLKRKSVHCQNFERYHEGWDQKFKISPTKSKTISFGVDFQTSWSDFIVSLTVLLLLLLTIWVLVDVSTYFFSLRRLIWKSQSIWISMIKKKDEHECKSLNKICLPLPFDFSL